MMRYIIILLVLVVLSGCGGTTSQEQTQFTNFREFTTESGVLCVVYRDEMACDFSGVKR
jgi:hypothetical protein